MPKVSFSNIQHNRWHTNPVDVRRYISEVYNGRDRTISEGSTLPLSISRIEFESLEDEDFLRNTFDNVTKTVTHETAGFYPSLLGEMHIRKGSARPSTKWHVDRSIIRPPRTHTFRFILSATKDPFLTTRYASAGSPMIGRSQAPYPLQPTPEEFMRAAGDKIYLVPTQQSSHASPETPTHDDAILFNRFVHFVIGNTDV